MFGAELKPILSRDLCVGIVLSLLVHLALAMGLATRSLAPDMIPVLETVAEEEPPLRLGIDLSEAVTVNWVGFEVPTEHSAPTSTVEQAGLTPVVGSAVAASEEHSSPEVVPSKASQARAEPRPEPAPPPEPESVPEPTRAMHPAEAEMPGPVRPASAEELARIRMEPGELLRPPVPAEPRAAKPNPPVAQPPREPKATPSPAPERAESKEAVKSAETAGTPGIQDERESDASALTRSLEAHPGRPVAAEGLQITTYRPVYGITVQAITNPRNPVVLIRFDRSGNVRRAEFIVRDGRRLDTGSVHVDGPLMDAIYRWTARGDAIEALRGNETLAVEIRLIMGN